ncbi:MAG: hypothetical protein JNK87_15360 [Bryobacterales bacterium]|nr:hypothetical protein [Bryobacterales bacterium]
MDGRAHDDGVDGFVVKTAAEVGDERGFGATGGFDDLKASATTFWSMSQTWVMLTSGWSQKALVRLLPRPRTPMRTTLILSEAATARRVAARALKAAGRT